jgi:hypothetical protein
MSEKRLPRTCLLFWHNPGKDQKRRSSSLTHISQTSILAFWNTCTFLLSKAEGCFLVFRKRVWLRLACHCAQGSWDTPDYPGSALFRHLLARNRKSIEDSNANIVNRTNQSPLCTIYASCSLLSATTCSPYNWTSVLPCAMWHAALHSICCIGNLFLLE